MHLSCLRNSAEAHTQSYKDTMIRTGLGLVDERRAELENPITLDVHLRPVRTAESQSASAAKAGEAIVVPQTNESKRAGTKAPSAAVVAGLLAKIPQQIKQAAESHIMRGTTKTGIVGNMRKVLLARDVFRQARDSHADLVTSEIESWLEHFDEDRDGETAEAESSNVDKEAEKTAWRCPRCRGPI